MRVKSSMSNASLASRPRSPRGSQARIAWIERVLPPLIRLVLGRGTDMDRAKLLTCLAVLDATTPNESNSNKETDDENESTPF